MRYIFSRYNDFDSPLKINETIVRQNPYETRSVKNDKVQAPGKMCNVKILAMLFSFTDITRKHKMTEKCKISLQNVINISFLHIEKHN